MCTFTCSNIRCTSTNPILNNMFFDYSSYVGLFGHIVATTQIRQLHAYLRRFLCVCVLTRSGINLARILVLPRHLWMRITYVMYAHFVAGFLYTVRAQLQWPTYQIHIYIYIYISKKEKKTAEKIRSPNRRPRFVRLGARVHKSRTMRFIFSG